jgi:hypothetical protein
MTDQAATLPKPSEELSDEELNRAVGGNPRLGTFGCVLSILLDCTVAQWSGSLRQRPRLPCARSRPVWVFVCLAPEQFATFSCRSGAPGSG